MLRVLHPPLMPHAVPFSRPLGDFGVQPPHHRMTGSHPYHIYTTGSIASNPIVRPGLPAPARELTPPSDMHVALNSSRPGSHCPSTHLDKDTSRHGHPCAQISQPYSSSSYAKPGAPRLNGAVKQFPSPKAQPGVAGTQEVRDAMQPVENSVAPSSRIPDTVKTPQSGIAQLAAEVTCLFWFEDATTIERIEALPSPPPPASLSPLCADAAPSVAFRKWVATILSTTQVTQNVILLALMFIWRLKKANPTVKGKPGSEFRLLTVALMLGNKFLDDNTYTNKTWAEVSGISVQEVHIMEVEFLSNMRYSLFTDTVEWMHWHVTLGKFGTYIDASTRMVHEQATRQAASLPSPPTSLHASPPLAISHSSSNATRTNTPLLLPQIDSTLISPIGPLPELNVRLAPRKRSYDEQAEEPPPKRLSRIPTQTSSVPPSMNGLQLPNPLGPSRGQRLPLPTLTIPRISNSSQPTELPNSQLPVPGRAMSTVYPAVGHATSLPPSIPAIGPTSLSPYPVSGTSSPLSATFGPGQIHSPSYFLQQRSSPYRPVRQPHMLLVPPPSIAQTAPRMVPYSHMQYHPLGRQTERHTGHLPYMHHEAWPQTHQLNQWPAHTPH